MISTSIEYEYWNNRFPHVDKAIYDRIGFQSYLCPKNSDFFVRANYNSENYELVQVNLYKWSGSNCKSDAEINDVINSHYIDIGIISTYFDFNDYTNPVKYYLQDDNYIYLIYFWHIETKKRKLIYYINCINLNSLNEL